MFIIQAPSGYRLGYLCLLGEGTTEAEAWADAYGPNRKEESLQKVIKKSGAFCKEVSYEEWEELKYNQ